MHDLASGTSRYKSATAKNYHRKLYPDVSDELLTRVAYQVWLTTHFTQAEACQLVGAKPYNLKALINADDVDCDAYRAGEISWRELVARYRLGNGEKALGRLGLQRVVDWLDTVTAPSSSES